MKLDAAQLRTLEVDNKAKARIKKNPIYIILDNVLDTYNIGSIFRLADALSVRKVFLCGATESPPNPRIKKASINTWQWVEWEHLLSAKEAIEKISKEDPLQTCKGSSCKMQVVAIEQDERSIPLKIFKPVFPLVLIVGNETYGVSKEVLDIANEIVELPMYGINKSLNVMVSCGIVLYKAIEFL